MAQKDAKADVGRVARPPCPVCESPITQPFTHAGAGARVNMKCINCGHLFKEPKPKG